MSLFTLWMIVINTTFWLVCCFGTAWVVHKLLPSSIYEKMKWLFKERSFEKSFYRMIHLVKWKDKLPEWGKVWSFEKNHLKQELSLEYVNRFILETYRAEIGHIGMAVLGFACVLVNPRDSAQMAMICSIVNVVVQIPFCLIQRFNRPRLVRLKARLEDRNHL
ncbi:glycosyl-4,4'-diaponeurosporenoate acyltransferase CrtO family protein [Niallia endozanthoxylica]|uniref:Glycosyl-4,4'-diaponeurosporenoate acyltransferase n=1 Tax=Niallia endozanthoxylica TaxID=2036016 RepID=A0A5J5I682_9BACI|nr:hypothetical protein [Niallia endozanthoxylica]KAA9029949.1 hypothetical protein F4V44_02795 [Niallia endozanthoxylica]